MFVVFKVEHFGCINLISKHAVFEEALAQVKNSVAAKLSSASTAFQTANGYYKNKPGKPTTLVVG